MPSTLLLGPSIMAAPPPLFSTLYDDPTKWDEPTPDYGALIALMGGVAGTAHGAPALFDRNQTMTGLTNLASRSPTLVAFCPADDNDYIYVGHTLSMYPTDPLAPLAFDGHVIAIVGDDPNSCQPVALPPNAFARTDVRAKTVDVIRGPTGFAAAPPVMRLGPHAAGTADTNNLSVRPVMLIPTRALPDILTTLPAGYYTYPAFYDNFIHGPMTSGDGALEALFEPLCDWWRAVCTMGAAADTSALQIDVTPPANVRESRYLDRWKSRFTNDLNVRLGHGGPALTSAAFAAGIADVRNVIETTNQANLDAERDRRNVTFEDKHGAALLRMMIRAK